MATLYVIGVSSRQTLVFCPKQTLRRFVLVAFASLCFRGHDENEHLANGGEGVLDEAHTNRRFANERPPPSSAPAGIKHQRIRGDHQSQTLKVK